MVSAIAWLALFWTLIQSVAPPPGDGAARAVGGDRVADIRQTAVQIVSGLECGRLDIYIDDDGVVTLSGHVAESADLDSALRRLTRLDAVIDVDVADVIWLPAPLCLVVDLVEQAVDWRAEPSLTVAALGEAEAAGTLLLRDYDYIELSLFSPDYPSYVSIDYYDAGGMVTHMLPNEWLPLNVFPDAGVRLDLDSSGDGGPAYQIGPPFGAEMVFAIAANRPLFLDLRPFQEPASVYMPALRQAIAFWADVADFRVDYGFVVLHTRE